MGVIIADDGLLDDYYDQAVFISTFNMHPVATTHALSRCVVLATRASSLGPDEGGCVDAGT